MFPTLLQCNSGNLTHADAMPLRQRAQPHPGGSLLSYFSDVNIQKLGSPVASTLGFYTVISATFARHIPVVCQIIPKEKMFWVDATRDIAMVENEEISGDRPIVNFPGDAMRPQSSTVMASAVNGTVAEMHLSSGPKPTTIGFINELPEPDVDRKSRSVSWHVTSISIMRFHCKN